MPILSELVVSIVGGVATALILGVLVKPASPDTGEAGRRRGGTVLGDLMHMLLAVAGGIAVALLAGKLAIQAGAVPQGTSGRLILLAGGTALSWLLLLPLRRR
ncbi:MAG: hypothetical protein AB7U75_15405 [Hyphomicrobiaceae bacterium]